MIISVSGRKYSGKDSSAEGLISRHSFKRVGLADKLKDICSEVFSIPRIDMDDQTKKEVPFTSPILIGSNHLQALVDILEVDGFPVTDSIYQELCKEFHDVSLTSIRHLLQFVGTDIVRTHIDNDVWLKYFGKIATNTDANIIVTDARFKNEREYLKSIGATLFLIKREGLSSGDSHISENQLGDDNDYDVIVYNDSCKVALQSSMTMWYVHHRREG